MAQKTITLANLTDLDNMLVASDSATPTGEVDFNTRDTSLTPTSSEEVELLTGSDSWSSRLYKISQMFKNVRYLLKMLGTTDISSIGNGTVTDAISTLNGKTIKDIVITERVQLIQTTAQIAAYGGATWVSIGGTALIPNIPDGYAFVGNVNVVVNGEINVNATFDGGNQFASLAVTPYIGNAKNVAVPVGKTLIIRLYSLCIKK